MQIADFGEKMNAVASDTQLLGISSAGNRQFGENLRMLTQYLQLMKATSEKLHYYADGNPGNVHLIDEATRFDNMLKKSSQVLNDLNALLKQSNEDMSTSARNDALTAYQKQSKEEYDKKFAGMSRDQIRAYLDKKESDNKGVKGFFGNLFGRGGMPMSSRGMGEPHFG